jgi:hypothetical protein
MFEAALDLKSGDLLGSFVEKNQRKKISVSKGFVGDVSKFILSIVI